MVTKTGTKDILGSEFSVYEKAVDRAGAVQLIQATVFFVEHCTQQTENTNLYIDSELQTHSRAYSISPYDYLIDNSEVKFPKPNSPPSPEN